MIYNILHNIHIDNIKLFIMLDIYIIGYINVIYLRTHKCKFTHTYTHTHTYIYIYIYIYPIVFFVHYTIFLVYKLYTV